MLQPPEQTTLFRAGEGDYHTYRIPAAVVTTQGTLLAFCEGRRDNPDDAEFHELFDEFFHNPPLNTRTMTIPRGTGNPHGSSPIRTRARPLRKAMPKPIAGWYRR